MSLTKSEKNMISKLESDVAYWKEQAVIVSNKQSKMVWSNYSNEIFLPDDGHIKFTPPFGGTFEVSMNNDGIKIYYHDKKYERMCVIPECYNVIAIKKTA